MDWLKGLAKSVLPARVWRGLHEWKLRRHVQEYPRSVVDRRIAGHPLRLLIADGLASNWYGRDWPSLVEVDFLKTHRLRPGARVFDCGAHQAVVAMVLAREVGQSGAVLAVEAMRHNCEVGRRNLELNSIGNVEIMEAGVAREPGTLRFTFGMNSSLSPASGSVEVPAVSIDQLATRYGLPDVLFIDIEGAELEALRGADRTLRTRPSCFVEVHVDEGLERMGGSSSEILSLLSGYGFQLHAFEENSDRVLPVDQCPPELFRKRFFLLAV